MAQIATGTPFHGEFSSADASALSEPNSRLTLYGAASTTALVLQATDIVIITDITTATAPAVTITVYDGADNVVDAGERVTRSILAVNQTSALSFNGHWCQAGTYPKVKASGAGQVDVNIHGYIIAQKSL